MTHDVLVVGAGPAGSMAALRLARAGVRVLLLEKAGLGRDKPCGGGLTPRAWRGLEVPVEDLVHARTRWATVRSGRRQATFDLGDGPVVMVRRRELDRRLAEAAAGAGAELRDRCAARGVALQGGGVAVSTDAGELRAHCLLLATGAEAPLRSALGLAPPAGVMAPAVELEVPARSPRLRNDTLLFDYSVPGGYAWAFPKGSEWNAGVVTARRDVGRELRQRLAAFMEDVELHPLDGAASAGRATGRRIPLWGAPRPLARGPVALLGDAAGLADPFFGEGIAQALESGRLAAAAALDLLAGRAEGMEPYSAAVTARMAPHLRRMRVLARCVYPAPALTLRALAAVAPLRGVARRVAVEPFHA